LSLVEDRKWLIPQFAFIVKKYVVLLGSLESGVLVIVLD